MTSLAKGDRVKLTAAAAARSAAAGVPEDGEDRGVVEIVGVRGSVRVRWAGTGNSVWVDENKIEGAES